MQSLASADSALAVQWIFGGAVVVVYAMDRFKHPCPMRATTTFWRYWSAWFGYLVAMLALFVFLGGGFTAVDSNILEPFLGIDSTSKDIPRLPAPLLSALILTSLLPHFPVLGKIDTAVKEWFQRVGNMPFEVRELSARLGEANYTPDPATVPLLMPAFDELHVDPAWLLAPSNTIMHRWGCCAALYGQIRRWEGARGYSRYVAENKVALADIRSRMTALAEILDKLTLTELDQDSDSRLVMHMRKNIEEGHRDRPAGAVRFRQCGCAEQWLEPPPAPRGPHRAGLRRDGLGPGAPERARHRARDRARLPRASLHPVDGAPLL